MILGKLIGVCSEELRKAGRAFAGIYATMREADERALQMLFILLGLR